MPASLRYGDSHVFLGLGVRRSLTLLAPHLGRSGLLSRPSISEGPFLLSLEKRLAVEFCIPRNFVLGCREPLAGKGTGKSSSGLTIPAMIDQNEAQRWQKVAGNTWNFAIRLGLLIKMILQIHKSGRLANIIQRLLNSASLFIVSCCCFLISSCLSSLIT